MSFSAIDAFAAGLVAEELVMTEAVAEEFWDTVNGGFLGSDGSKRCPSEGNRVR